MPTERLTAFDQAGLEIINRKLETFDLHQKQLANQKTAIAQLNAKLLDLQNRKQTVGANNLLITWTGSTTTLSWPAAFVQDKDNVNYPVVAGSFVGTASTYYWFGWNPIQQIMSVQSVLTTLTGIPGMIVICRIYTGTAGQTGQAGGGGTEASGVGSIGSLYKLF